MIGWLTASPILVPLSTAALCMVFWASPRLQRGLSLAGSILLMVLAGCLMSTVQDDGIQVVQMGSWAAPFGITLVADPLSALLIMIAAMLGFAVALYSLGDIDPVRERGGYHPVFQVLMTGVCGGMITGDLFNLYVWFEVMLISSFVLLSLGGTREQIDGAVKYAAINLVATAALLLAVALIYGMTGTLNMADLAVKLPAIANKGLVTSVAVLFIIAFGMKAALFPFFFWLPAAYHTPVAAVQAIFGALLTKVGVYALIRVFTLIFVGDREWTHAILLWLAVGTMILGGLGALAMRDLRRAWSWQVVAHIGTMVAGLALATPLALAGAIFYMVHDMVVKAGLFLGAGVVARMAGGHTGYDRLGGLFKAAPWLCLLLFIPMAALAGFPPLSGFWGKYALVRAGLSAGAYAAIAALLVTGLLTIWLVGRIWMEMVWKPYPADHATPSQPIEGWRGMALVLPLLILALLSTGIGVRPELLMNISSRAAAGLIDPTDYIEAVLGQGREGPTMIGAVRPDAVTGAAP